MNKKQEPGMSLIVKTVTRLTAWLILLYGINIIVHGHLTPGGGFAGGVIIALSFIHLTLAYGKESVLRKLSNQTIHAWESVGALAFLAIALLGWARSDFFANLLPTGDPFNLFSAGSIPLSNIAISIKVWAGLFSIFLAMVLIRIKRGDK